MEAPRLDREAARRDVAEIDRWEREVHAAYVSLHPHVAFSIDNVAANELSGLAEFEQAARDDREWAEGYRRGLADARRDDNEREGPGVMRDDPKDGWSASVTRRDGYALGLQDGL